MRRRGAGIGASLLLTALAPTRAGADCQSFPFDPLCGSYTQSGASSGNSSIASQHFDADPTDPNQFLGPAYTERLADLQAGPGAEGNIVHESASTQIAIDAGVMAIVMGADSDAHDFGANAGGGGASRIAYDEEIEVQSSTLPANTPVTVTLRFRVAYGFHLAHTAQVLDESMQYSEAQVQANAFLDNHTGASPDSQNRWFTYLGFAPILTGLFQAADPVVNLSVPTQVGQHVRLDIFLDGSVGTESSILAGEVQGSAAETVALVFGMEADTPGVTLQSSLVGGPLPDFSNVSRFAADAQLLPVPLSLTVPEPESSALELAALLALLATGYAGSHARA